MIARRHLRLLIALLLPLMVLRGLLPAGYMPVAEGGQLRMALCSDGLQLAPGRDDVTDHRLPGSHGDCLFAQASAAAPPPALPALAVPEARAATAAATLAAQLGARLLARAQSPRGPPVLL